MTEPLDFGRCDRCRHFSPLAAKDAFEPYPVGICQWKWRSCSPYDAVPLMPADSHCKVFEPRPSFATNGHFIETAGNQAKGGYARAANLSPERRSEIARKAASSRWRSAVTKEAP